MIAAVPAAEQKRGGRPILVEHLHLAFYLIGRPAVPGSLQPQVFHGVGQGGQLASTGQAVELRRVTAVVHPPLLLPPCEAWHSAKNHVGHFSRDILRHPPEHVGELSADEPPTSRRFVGHTGLSTVD
jgi:hypothetical protein